MEHIPDASEEAEVEPGVYLAQLAVGEEMSVQHLRMDPGAVIPDRDHEHEQVGFVYEGERTFVLEDGQVVAVQAGGSYSLGSNKRHAAENRGETTLRAIDVFSPPPADPDWLE